MDTCITDLYRSSVPVAKRIEDRVLLLSRPHHDSFCHVIFSTISCKLILCHAKINLLVIDLLPGSLKTAKIFQLIN